MPSKVQNAKQTNEAAQKRDVAKPAAQGPIALTQQADLGTLQRTVADPRATRPSDILALQRTVGNQAVLHLLGRASASPWSHVQFKLTVGPASDRYEQEADRVAEQVVSMQPPSPVRRGVGGEVQTRPLVQRQSTTGLAGRVRTAAFAQDIYVFWKNPKNKDKPLKDLSDFTMKKVNEKLPYPCRPTYSTTGTAGAFDRVSWTIEMNTADFSQRSDVSEVGDLNQDEVAEIVDTIYHEARHSEQAFRIAQMQAGQGKTAKQIETGLSIPAKVAAAAAKKPLKGGSVYSNKLIEEAKKWEPFTGGRYEKYVGEVSDLRDEINDMRSQFDSGTAVQKISKLTPKISTIETHLQNFFDKEKDKIEKIKTKDSVDKSVLKHIKEIRAAFDKLKTEFNTQKGDATKHNIPKLEDLATKLHEARYAAYRDYEDEKDAWAVGGAAGAAFRELGKK